MPPKVNQAIDVATLLDDVEVFVSRFVVYPSEAARIAHVLWIGHAHLMSHWESTPRIAFLSPEPGSGKSRALEVTGPLVPRPIHAVNASPAYLFRKVSDEDGVPTILYDEIDTLFGPKAKDNEEVRGMINAGHRRGAMAGRCVIRGKTVMTEELPAYCAVALAGLDDLPDTIRTRSVIVRMRRRAPGERVEPWRARLNEPQGHVLRDRLAEWAGRVESVPWPDMPEGIEDRNADVWEALLAVADLAGAEWPARARVAAVTVVTEALDNRQTFGVQLLTDLHEVFGTNTSMSTEEILEALHGMEDAPWGDLRGKPMSPRDLSSRLRKYTTIDGDPIKPTTIREGTRVFKGYRRSDLLDAWSRYLPAKPDESVTSVTTVTDQDAATITPTAPVTGVTDVTAESPNARVLDLIPDELLDDDGNCRLHHDDPAAPEDCYTCSILLARPW